jgi:hypothetical protein
VPEQAQLLAAENTCALMPEFVDFYRSLVTQHCHKHAPHISADAFFSRLLQDDIFSLNEGRVVAAFKQAAQGLIEGRPLNAPACAGALLVA